MIDETKTKAAAPGKKPAAAKAAKPAKSVAAPADTKPAVAAVNGKTPDLVKAVPAAPARNPLKPKPATPVVPLERVRPVESKAVATPPAPQVDPVSKNPDPVSKNPEPVSKNPEPAPAKPEPVAAKPEPAPRTEPVAVAVEAAPVLAIAPVEPVAAPAPVAPPVAAAPQPVVAPAAPAKTAAPAAKAKIRPAKIRPAKISPAKSAAAPEAESKPAAEPAAKPASKPGSGEIIDIPAAFEAFRRPAEAVGEELPKTFRTLASTGLDQTRDAYQRMRLSAERLGEGFEDGAKTAQTGLHEFQNRWFDAVRSQTDATLGFMKAMSEARTLSDVIELNAAHARRRFEDASSRAKDLAAVANRTLVRTGETVRKAVTDSIAPRG